MGVLSCIACVASLLVSTGAMATPVTVGFSGRMSEVPSGFFDPTFPGISVGSTFTGTYTIDPDDLVSTEPTPLRTLTLHYLSEWSGSLQMEGHSFPLGIVDGQIGIANDYLGVTDSWGTTGTASEGAGLNPSFGVGFLDDTATRLVSQDFFVPTSLVGWSFGQVTWTAWFPGDSQPTFARGTLDTVFVVPEPSSAALMVFGLAGLAIQGRVRQRAPISS